MMLLGFAGLGFMAYRQEGRRFSLSARLDSKIKAAFGRPFLFIVVARIRSSATEVHSASI